MKLQPFFAEFTKITNRKIANDFLETVNYSSGELILNISMRSPINETFQMLENKHKEIIQLENEEIELLHMDDEKQSIDTMSYFMNVLRWIARDSKKAIETVAPGNSLLLNYTDIIDKRTLMKIKV